MYTIQFAALSNLCGLRLLQQLLRRQIQLLQQSLPTRQKYTEIL